MQRVRARFALMAAILAGAAVCAGGACAQPTLFGPDTLHGLAEVDWGAANGERGWLDGGFGKAALSGARDGGWKASAGLSQAVVEWRPQLGFATSAVVSAQWQADVDPGLDLNEAYLKIRAPPVGGGRLSGRAGVFYPPVSLEHEGVGWTTTELISASALNSWIGEEVKVGGVEATYQRRFGGHELSATGAVFGWNDTSGTLLSFRGWALHGVRTGVQTEFQLPPLSAFMGTKQSKVTDPMWEIDGRAGYYGRLEWRPPAPVILDAFYYDNRGDRVGVRELQWAWETRFANLGLSWNLDDRTRLRAQVLSGRTWMGFATPQVWVDVGFRAAYVLVTRQLARGTVSGRVDWFETRDHTWLAADNNDESGWAATAGWRQPLGPRFDLLLEAQHVEADRPSRALAAEAAKQPQTKLQSALRFHF